MTETAPASKSEDRQLQDKLAKLAKQIERREEKKRSAPVVVERNRMVITGKPIGELTAKHREIARQVATGSTNQQIADDLGMSYNAVAQIKTSSVVKAHVAQLQEIMDAKALETKMAIHDLLPMATQALKQALGSSRDSVALRAAQTTFGISGLVAPKNINVNEKRSILTGEDMLKIQERALAHARHRGEIVDV